MDTITQPVVKRRSRFKPEPRGYSVRGGIRQFQLLDLLYRYPNLPTSYIKVFLGTAKYHETLLTRFGHEGYLEHHPESLNLSQSLYRDMCWSLSQKGHEFLAASTTLVMCD
jgi:hypothetical protein